MRTKTLLLAAAALAAGLATSTAQTVYSQNVVGYINQVIPVGFSMVANQVDYDGTGTNNTVANVLPTPPNGTHLYKFTGTGYTIDNYFFGWNDSNFTLNPGEGVFINNPGPNPITNTFVGTVLQGTFTNAVPAGFSMKGYFFPITGAISTDLGYPVANGDHIYTWTGTNYMIYNYFFGWAPSEPTINVGQSFFIYRGTTLTNWVKTFSVQ